MERLTALWLRERPALPLWTPVLLGLGVQIYFWSPVEPSGWALSIAVAAPLIVWAIGWRRLRRVSLLGFALALIAIGFSLAGARARLVEAPVLTAQMDATVEGVIREVNRTRTGRPRLVLDELVIFGLQADATPERVQISLLKEKDLATLAPGERVSVFAHIGPPGRPVEPGGFDYRRTAWFLSIGGVGYARGAPVAIANDAAPSLARRLSLALARIRAELSAGLRDRLPGEAGAFAAAVTVGDRAGVSRESLQALRDANLAHLLAISGLHMGMVTALVFGAARLLLALTPFAARRWRIKRVAAVIALIAAVAYLGLSGASIATQRAFIMAAVALTAVVLNRPAITMRALATAALIILIYRPESLTHVGFQMSFAATAAIIAGFDFARESGWTLRVVEGGPGARFLGYATGLAATSLLAGLATAPFGAFHFNQMSHYGLIANLAAVPIMGFLVAPAAMIAAPLALVGLEAAPLAVMAAGIEAIMSVARFVAGLDGATRPVAATAPVVLTLIAMGGLGLCLGRYALRYAGIACLALGLLIWGVADVRPDVLVAPQGRLIGVDAENGRRLDHAKSESYAARVWLQRDGDRALQEEASARGGFARGYSGSVTTLANGWRVSNVLSRRPDEERLAELCAERTVIFAPSARKSPEGPCLFFGEERLDVAGAVSINLSGDDVKMTTSAEVSGDRLWTRDGATYDAVAVGRRSDR